jgi:filamentous hemagglutinin family protein
MRMGKVWSRCRFQPLKSLTLGSAATAMLLMAATGGATAQVPGGFTTNQSGTEYTGSTTSATITISGAKSNNVLQWGSALPGGTAVDAPGGLTGGFSIGNGATLTMTGGNGATLVNDVTGYMSQILGKLDASTLPGPLYIANQSGITVGNQGIISAPAQGVGLLAYEISSPGTFDGTLSIAQGTPGDSVTVQRGASITGGPILIAGADTVNVALPHIFIYASGHAAASSSVCINRSCSTVDALVGVAFKTGPDSVVPLRPPHHGHH